MALKPTKDQQQAIDINGTELLLSAAAGSGKTAVLIERIFRIITDKNLKIDVDKLLVVTFTDAAAQEMKLRLIERLEKSLEENPNDKNLIKQMNLANYANISTLHSFCMKVIRQNFNEIDIDPSFKIANNEESTLLMQEAIFETMEQKYIEGTPAFCDLIEIFGNKVIDNGFMEILQKLYQYSKSSPFPKEWLKKVVEQYNKENYKNINDINYVAIIKEYCIKKWTQALKDIKKCIKICEINGGMEKCFEDLIEIQNLTENLLTAINRDISTVYYFAKDIKIKTLYIYRGKAKDLLDQDAYQKIRDIYKNNIKSEIETILSTYFFKSMEEMMEDVFKLYDSMKELESTINLLDQSYSAKKREKNLLDFNDLEHFALKILISKENGYAPTEIAKEYQSFFHEILVDEYQDTNLVQDAIISAVSGKSNKFMVGDVKQSIYKFRRAKPELFMEKYLSFGKKPEENNLKIDLSQNFRSRNVVLDGINFLFTQLMSIDFGGIPYDHSAMLYLGAQYDDSEKMSTSIDCIVGYENSDDDVENSEIEENEEIEEMDKVKFEARLIGMEIQNIVINNELMLQDGPLHRKAMFSDIVVLLRSLTSINVFIEEFKIMNIPAFGINSVSYFSSLEVQTVISLLQIIDNSYQDIHLVTVLHSPIYNIDSSSLLNIRGSNGKTSFYESINNYIIEHEKGYLTDILEKFISDLKRWKQMSKKSTISELIWSLYTETKYNDYVAAMEGGLVRVGNLKILQEKASQYEKTSFKGLFNFLKYLEKLQNSDTEVTSAKSTSENENAVKIMSIHKSKGLEFPIVFVSQTGKFFNVLDERSNLVMHEELGFSFKYFDQKLRISHDTLSRQAIIKRTHEENLAEELRILYVALTRAKEKLVITGIVKDLKKKKVLYEDFAKEKAIVFSPDYLVSCKSQLDFILPCLLRHKGCDTLRNYFEVDDMGNKDLYNYKCKFSVKLINKEQILKKEDIVIEENIKMQGLTVLDKDIYSNVVEEMNWQYDYVKIPSKISITELKRKNEVKNFYDFTLEDISIKKDKKNLCPMPKFLSQNEFGLGAKKGTILHKIMENSDANIHNTIEKVQELAQMLIEKSILTKEEIALVDLDKISKFYNSDLGKRIGASKNVNKEVAFVGGIKSSEILPDIEGDEDVLIHGCIDCYFEENNNIILIDYKSDFYDEKTLPNLLNSYKIQLDIYRKALENGIGKKVTESYIYLFHKNEFKKIF